MDGLIKIARTISNKFILCENAYANYEMKRLTELLLQKKELLNDSDFHLIVEHLVVAQEHKNYVYVADLLEYQLVPLLLKYYTKKSR